MKKFLVYISKHPVIIIICVALFSMKGYMLPGIPIVDDGQDHVARIANFYMSLREGVFIPRWAANLNWGYGHPVVMFLYPLSSYLGSAFHSLGLSFASSTKCVFIVATVLSVWTMYLWLKEAWGKESAIIGSLLYLFAPYRFVDIYVRGAIGEHVAFIFPPLILYALLQLSRKKDAVLHGLLLGGSWAFFILAHNAFSIIFFPLICLYGIYLFVAEAKYDWRFLITGIAWILIGFGMSGFFWIPAYFEGKYTLRDIVTRGEALTRFVPVSMFIYSPWVSGGGNETTKFLGLPQWIGVIGSIVLWRKTKDKNLRWFIFVTLMCLVGTIFIMTSWSRFIWEKFMILQNFQFPWRFQMISVFLTAVLAGVSIPYLCANIEIKKKHIAKYIFVAFCVFSILITISMWKPRGYLFKQESFYTGIYNGTTDTGESSPIWSVRFMEHKPNAELEVIDGDAIITNGFRSSTVHEYSVRVIKPTLFLENTVYFPNWSIYVDGAATEIQYQNPNYRGLMTFEMAPGTHSVRVVFENTKLRMIAERISLVALAIIGVTVFSITLWRKKR